MKNYKKLFLLDAYALIYRAYFAFIKNPRINSKGINTSAVFGFTNSLLEIIRKESPSHLAVVFDTSKPTERHVQFPEYKAQREKMPEELRDSLPYIDRLLEAFNIPKLYKDGYEADDVIGTLAKKAEKEGFTVYMMTPDKDFAQLVSDNIFMYRPATKWRAADVWGVPEVLEKFKIKLVSQVIDFLAMMGDSADNIPGIAGVGEKTAQKFIKEYGSIEGLFENTHHLKGKIKEKVEESRGLGMLCKKLVTIITDVPINFNEEDLQLTEKNQSKITELFDELEFRNLKERVLGPQLINKDKKETKAYEDENAGRPVQIDLFSSMQPLINEAHKYKTLSNKNDIVNALSEVSFHDKVALQVFCDTNDALTTNIAGYAISTKKNSYYIVHSDEHIKLLNIILSNLEIEKIGFNIKFLIKVLKRFNLELLGDLFDIENAHYLLHPDKRHALGLLANEYLGLEIIDKQSIIGRGNSKQKMSTLSNKKIEKYATQESDAIFKLHIFLKQELEDADLISLFKDLEMPLSIVLAKMELEGVMVDKDMLLLYSAELSDFLNKKTNTIYKLAGESFNISSPKQMGEILFDKMKLIKKPKKTKSGQYSTSEETLTKLKHTHSIIEEILEFRGIKKLLSTYVDALPNLINVNTNRIHTTFNQSVASTGRLSSTNPNLQNIPIRTSRGMKVRKSFISRNENYKLLAADYSQIELRIMASLSQDEGMVNAFNEGVDIHSATAAKIYKVAISDVDKSMRFSAKSVNFGIIYGISPFGLSQNIGVSRKEAKDIIDQYFQQFPSVRLYMDKVINIAKEQKYVETLMGRRRYLNDINSRNAVIRGLAERNAINAPIQGSAADIIKKAMISIQREIEKRSMKSKMILQVHDELVFDMHISEVEVLKHIVKKEMETAIKLRVPLIVALGEGDNWLQAH